MENTIENTKKPSKTKRIEELDIVKGLVIISVMMRHLNEILGLQAAHPDVASLFSWMLESFMVVFFILSGYVYTQKGNVWQEILKRIKQLLIPLLIYSCVDAAIYFVRYIIIDHASFSWYIQKIGLGFLGFSGRSFFCPPSDGPNYLVYAFAPNWFIHQLFPAFVIFIIAKALCNKTSIWFRVFVALVLIAISTIFSNFDVQNTLKDTYDSYVPFSCVLINIFGFAGVLMVGSILREINLFDIDSLSHLTKVVFLIISAAIVFSVYIDYSLDGYALQYGRWSQYGPRSVLNVTIGGICLTYVMVFIAYFLKKITFFKAIFTFMGRNSLTFLLLHMAVGESLCAIGGFWYPVYSDPYPVEKFSYAKWIVVVVLTFVICTSYILLKNLIKSKIAKKKS